VDKTNRRTELTNFGITTLHVSGSISAHHQEFLAVHRHWYWNCNFHPASGSKRSSKLHKMYQCRCTAKNSWWWVERPPETCRVVIPKFGIQCVCWFYPRGICHGARSYDPKKK